MFVGSLANISLTSCSVSAEKFGFFSGDNNSFKSICFKLKSSGLIFIAVRNAFIALS